MAKWHPLIVMLRSGLLFSALEFSRTSTDEEIVLIRTGYLFLSPHLGAWKSRRCFPFAPIAGDGFKGSPVDFPSGFSFSEPP